MLGHYLLKGSKVGKEEERMDEEKEGNRKEGRETQHPIVVRIVPSLSDLKAIVSF